MSEAPSDRIDAAGSRTDLDLDSLLIGAAGHGLAYRSRLRQQSHTPLPYPAMLSAFEAPTPEEGEAAEAVIDDLARLAEPGLQRGAGPRFFGWVIGASHPVGVAADWLAAAWGQNTGNHMAAPAASAVETVAARWLLDILDLPRGASVGFVTGATMANFVGLAAARSEVLRRVGWDVEARGLNGAPPITVIIGEEAHATVFSALQFLGLGHDSACRVPTDGQGAMDPLAFARTLDAVEGPLIVITQAGQLNTGAFDPHEAIVPLACQRGAWVHVDGAFGLWARACPRVAPQAAGVELADSWATDGHKWLQTPYDCGYAIVRDAEAHRRAMTIAASYLPPVHEGERDPSHFVPELSRRARGLPTYAILRHLGRRGVAAMVDRHCRLAAEMARLLASEDDVDILNEVCLNQVIVRFGANRGAEAGDRLTLATIEEIQRDGTCFAGGAKWRGLWVMRLSVIGFPTTGDDIARSAEAILAAYHRARARA